MVHQQRCGRQRPPLNVTWIILVKPGHPGLVEVSQGKRADAYLVRELDAPDGRAWSFAKRGGDTHHIFFAQEGWRSCDCPDGADRGNGDCRHCQAIVTLFDHEAARHGPIGDCRCRQCGSACEPKDQFCSLVCQDNYFDNLPPDPSLIGPPCEECGDRMLVWQPTPLLCCCPNCEGFSSRPTAVEADEPTLNAAFAAIGARPDLLEV